MFVLVRGERAGISDSLPVPVSWQQTEGLSSCSLCSSLYGEGASISDSLPVPVSWQQTEGLSKLFTVLVSVWHTGECISGALQWRQLMEMATEIGFAPPVLVTSTLYTSQDKSVADLLGETKKSRLEEHFESFVPHPRVV